MKIIFFLISSQLWLITSASYAQTFERITTLDGLSNNTVISILQDKKGYMWFGTDDGLNKFNGYEFTKYKPDAHNNNSLSNAVAKVLFEDSNGIIWIGTDGGGLSRFDPTRGIFKTFFNDPDDPFSLSHNHVSAIAEDKNKILWIGTYGGGLNRFDKETGQFTHFKNITNDPESISSNFINCLLFDSTETLWVGTWGRGLCQLDISTNHFKTYLHNEDDEKTLSNNTVNCLFEDQQQGLWIGTWGGGLSYLNADRKEFQNFTFQDKNTESISHNIVRSICGDKSGSIWIATFGGGLNQLDPKTGRFMHFQNDPNNTESLSNDNLWSVYYSKDNKVWTGSIGDGINLIDLDAPRFEQINLSNDPFKPTSITSMVASRSKDIWVGTNQSGLLKLNESYDILEKFTNDMSDDNSLINNSINSILEDKFGHIWIGTQDGLSKYDPLARQFKHYQQTFNTYKCLSFNVVTDIYEDHLGSIWVATWGGGLNRYNRETDEFDYYMNLKKVKVTFYVDMTGIPISKDGIHIAGSMNGWNPSSDRLEHIEGNVYGIEMNLYTVGYEYKFLNGNHWGTEEVIPNACAVNANRIVYPGNHDIALNAVLFGKGCNQVAITPPNIDLESNEKVISSNHIYRIFEDQTGTLWIGTNNGFNKYNRADDLFTKFKHIRGDATSLSNNHVNQFWEDKNDNLWIGTLGGGLNRYDRETQTFVAYDEKKGLANNNTRSLTEDTQGNLWITTNVGISCLNTRDYTIRNYDASDGLPDNSFHSGTSLALAENKILLAGANGLTMFNPKDLEDSQEPPQVYLTDLYLSNHKIEVGEKVNNRVILSKTLENTDLVVLSYKSNIVTIHFTAIQYSRSRKNQFAYRLEGFDSEWHYVDAKNRMATYTNLSAGTYTLHVKASNRDGVWSENTTQLKMIITPPFWRTIWFKILLTVLVLGLAYLWYMKRVYHKRKAILHEKLIAEKKIIELEKHKLEMEIEHKNTELGTIAIQMMNKSRMISEQTTRLKWIMRSADIPMRRRLSQLVKKLSNDLDQDKDWEYFELHFDKIYQNFLTKLKNKYPALPATDIRLAAYIRMGLSSKEITELMNVSIRSVESRRYRLRKSMDLNQGENLTDFIFKL